MKFGPDMKDGKSSLNAAHCETSFKFLQAGKRYTVIREFTDYDQRCHPKGEQWTFSGYSSLPYEDGISFFVTADGQQEYQVRLQWRPEEQGYILDNLADYINIV